MLMEEPEEINDSVYDITIILLFLQVRVFLVEKPPIDIVCKESDVATCLNLCILFKC